jgi:hypothetical protein
MITMRIDDYGVNVEIENEGQKSFKYLSMPKFQQLALQDYNFDTGLLPVGTVAFKRSGAEERLAIVQPAGIKHVKFEVDQGKEKRIEEYKIFPVPPLLWIFKLDLDKCLKETKVFALQSGFVVANTMLFDAPFSNVSSQNGNVCWGNNKVLDKPFKTLVGLSSLPKIFFSQPFNKDLDEEIGNPDHKLAKTLMFFRQYNGQKKFPLEILKEYRKFQEVWDED